ncbi:MAG: hypothetical protein JOY90_18560 [Bradyrhizobium sp.]|uniref:hypothetical protein n=1 Tax=Bradyrhizobium sp. TaxID=376 RepID=UPI001D2720BD|nr:hypothetical protein [Bradyrhizobium sp.]MBV9562421.1 hypothetical protein [Bradyrhizobium sp.]
MPLESIRPIPTILALSLALTAPGAVAFEFPKLSSPAAQAVPPDVIAEYRRKLKVYQEARAAYYAEADTYWASIVEKRRGRNAKRRAHEATTLDDYVLTQPPVYVGPKRPVNPAPETEPQPPERPRDQKYVPVVTDLLKAAAEYYQWAPERPVNDIDFKRAYARFALSAGLTRQQAVRVYAFETGGNGTHASQSGFHGTHAISTAVGYNQLLTTNSVELLAEQGEGFVRILSQRAVNLSGAARRTMDQKIAVLQKMVAMARSVPDDWSEHEKIGDTPKGWALHAMVLDIDVGPMLQTHKLLTSVQFARERGFARPLTAAELEMMNLTGDGTGLDMVTMPQPMREQVATANFFQRSGYERNPVASHYNTVAKLLAITDQRMDANAMQPGAKELAAAF